MAKSNGQPYSLFSYFIIRSPLFPFVTYKNFIRSEKDLKSFCKQTMIRETIFLASPSLYDEMQKWMDANVKDPKEIKKIQLSLLRYFLRMSSRCTPFGLFAGFCTGNWDNETEINFLLRSSSQSHTRLDMNYLCALAQDVSNHPEIKPNIKFFSNSSIYELGKDYRYVEYFYKNSKRFHRISSVERSEYLETILKLAAKGEYIRHLTESLVDDEITIEDASEFINELISSQLLVSELEPSITETDYLKSIIRLLKKNAAPEKIISHLSKVYKKIQQLNHEPIGRSVKRYYDIANTLEKLKTKYELKFLFQADLVHKAKTCTIKDTIKEQLCEGFEVLNKLTAKYPETYLEKFRNAFYERYEEKEMPLLKVLDNETGIGYLQDKGSGDINILIDDLQIQALQQNTTDIQLNSQNKFLLKKYHKALSSKKTTIEITDNDLKNFKSNWDDLPDTMSSMIRVLYVKEDKHKIFMNSASGSSAANLLGRFCHADESTFEYVKEIMQKEEELKKKNTMLAEIIHLPESRTGNILLRPVLRKFEIPYLAKSSVHKEHQISLQDLYISVRQQRVVLRSKILNKEILPRLTVAHNYSFNALPVYQFLCDLQTQNLRSSIAFQWGALTQNFDFLPRVVYKNLVLSLAQWNIKKEEIDKKILKEKDPIKQVVQIVAWVRKRKIPDEVYLADADNELYIDFRKKRCVNVLLDLIKNRPSFILKEFPFDMEHPLVENRQGGFTNEIIVSFYKNKDKEKRNE